MSGRRLRQADLAPNAIEVANTRDIMRMRDPDDDLVVFTAARRPSPAP